MYMWEKAMGSMRQRVREGLKHDKAQGGKYGP